MRDSGYLPQCNTERVHDRRILPWLLTLTISPTLYAVTPLPAGALLRNKANFFDLAHRWVRFAPSPDGSYNVTVRPSPKLVPRGIAIGKPSPEYGYAWRFRLPFRFPFAGQRWGQIDVNLNGNITFEGPETTTYPARATWSEGSMRSLAALIDTRAIDGRQRTIAPFWGLNSAEKTRIFTRSSSREFVVTWDAVRYQSLNEGYEPLGRSEYQVRLAPDGSIDFRYGAVSEKDGVVGVFPGRARVAKPLDSIDLPATDTRIPDIRRVTVGDLGSTLHFAFAVARLPAGRVSYRTIAYSEGEGYVLILDVDSHGATSRTSCFLVGEDGASSPTDCSVTTLALKGDKSVHMYLPKIGLKNPSNFQWKAEALFWPNEGSDPVHLSTGSSRQVSLRPMPSRDDLSKQPRARAGSIYEVFHYPFVPKARHTALKDIYKRTPAGAELVIVLTDFRIDDIHNHGPSNRVDEDQPLSAKELFGSSAVQSVAGPIYLGPRFRETMRDEIRTYKNYAFAVGWMAHELIHRWGARLRWKAENPMALLDPSCYCHWNPLLNTPAVTPVSQLFTDKPYPEESVMGGMTVEKQPDGSQAGRTAPWGAATGLSALDLYVMGLIGPDEVPETFLVVGATAGKGGESMPVRIADIIAANGPPKEGQREFKLGIYLLHEDGREPHPERLAQARGIEAALIEYFSVATGGRMKIKTAGSSLEKTGGWKLQR